MNKLSNIHSSELNISDKQWPNIGKKLAERVWKSRKELNEQKDTIQNLTFLKNYYLAFPSYLISFFESLCREILKNKLKIFNAQLKSQKKSLKQLNE